MKAVVYTEYGPPEVLKPKEVEKPAPKDDEILIRVHAATVNFGDLMARNFAAVTARSFHMPALLLIPTRFYFGVRKPKVNILGAELAGEVEAVGRDVKRFKPGDRVFGYPGQSMGAYAEYLCMPEDGCVAVKPDNISDEEAAAAPYGALMALGILKKVNLRPGQKVLINGASGGIGSAAVQLARSHYRAEVTGVCGTPRLEYVKSLGAEKVIDYTKEDFTQNGETYDLIFDILGKRSFSEVRDSLKPGGCYLLSSFKLRHLLSMLWTAITGSKKKVICAFSSETAEDLMAVKELIEAGKIKTIIDRCYPLEQTAEAHRYIENGEHKGKVVITQLSS